MSISFPPLNSPSHPHFSVEQLNSDLNELSLALDNSISLTIQQQLPQNSLIIPSSLAEQILLQLSPKSKKRFLPVLASIAMQSARCEVSGQAAGVAALGKSGSIYLAHNIEFPNCPTRSFVHPIQYLIASMRSSGETGICEIALSKQLTGTELDFIKELAGQDDCKIVTSMDDHFFVKSLQKTESHNQKLELSGGLINDTLTADIEGQLEGLAQCAGHHSYSPLIGLQSGIALQTTDGKVYTGSYLETHGYTTLEPLQAALASLLSDKKSYEEITNVILAEKFNSKISLQAQTAELLKSIAPKVTLQTVPF